MCMCVCVWLDVMEWSIVVLRTHNTILSYIWLAYIEFLIEPIDFIRPHVSTRECKIHDKIYGKTERGRKMFYSGFLSIQWLVGGMANIEWPGQQFR